MRRDGLILVLAAALALTAVLGRAVASVVHVHHESAAIANDHAHDHGNEHGQEPGGPAHGSDCVICDAVHATGDLPRHPPLMVAPMAVRLAERAGREMDPVIFGITASNSRGPPAVR